MCTSKHDQEKLKQGDLWLIQIVDQSNLDIGISRTPINVLRRHQNLKAQPKACDDILVKEYFAIKRSNREI